MTNGRPCLRRSAQGVLLEVYVQPKASRNEVVGLHQGYVKLRLTAPPVEGEANRACLRYLAKLFGVPKSDLELVQGHKSRQKTILIRTLTAEAIEGVLRAHGVVSQGGEEAEP